MKSNYIHRKKNIAYLCFLLFASYACIDVIDLSAEDKEQEILIIEATVHQNTQEAIVKLSHAASFAAGPDGTETAVTGATVKITEVDGPVFELIEGDPGTYTSSEPLGTVGKEYILEVQNKGETYISSQEKMPKIVPVQNVDYIRREETFTNASGNLGTREFLVLRSSATFPNEGEDIFLRYRVSGIYEYQERPSLNDKICYISEQIDFNQLGIIDAAVLPGGVLTEEPFLEKLIDHRLAFNYCFTIVQLAMTQSEYTYWNSVKSEFERTGDIFETPPAKINGNIRNSINTKNDVIGLFSLIASDTLKLNTNGLDLGAPRGQCQGFRSLDRDSPCFNCIKIANSTYNKPECF